MSLDLLAVLILMQLRIQVAFWAEAHIAGSCPNFYPPVSICTPPQGCSVQGTTGNRTCESLYDLFSQFSRSNLLKNPSKIDISLVS